MDKNTISLLREWAKMYNTKSFIKDDPVQFPRRFTEKRDIEISAFLTAWISYGRREHICQKAEELHRMMGESPYKFIRAGETSFAPLRNRPVCRRDTFYRFYTYNDLHLLCCRLKDIYDTYDSLEDAMAAAGPCEDPILRLQQLFAGLNGIPVLRGTSACKRLAMFLRWMARTDGIVDLGIWKTAVHPRQLIIPLDTHVHQISLRLGLTDQKTATLRTAREITDALAKVFPDDPCLGDFALFGYDINRISSVCVYCASSTKIPSIYFDAAKELGRLLGEQKLRVVNGAGNIGLMCAVSDAALAAGGTVTGVIPHFMVEQDWYHKGLTELIEVETMHERKQRMANLSDAVIALPGGCGTLEELLEIITWKQLGLYLNPIVILNINHYYDPLLELLRNAMDENFMRPQHARMWAVAETPEEAVRLIHTEPKWDASLRKIAAI